MHDPIFLRLKSEVATKEDLQVAEDLLDTLIANKTVVPVIRRIAEKINEAMNYNSKTGA